jgi:hypothetical protein
MSPFDVSVFNTGKKIVTLNFLNREFRIQSENGNIELDELTAKGKAKHFNQKVDLTPDELAEYNSIQKDISENGTTRENNKRSNDLTNKIIDRLNIGNEVEKLGQNKNQQVVEIKNALDAGEYQKAIADGKMTSADAKKIIESAGFEVPKEILEAQAPTQYTEAATPAKKESSGVSGSALKDVESTTKALEGMDKEKGKNLLKGLINTFTGKDYFYHGTTKAFSKFKKSKKMGVEAIETEQPIFLAQSKDAAEPFSTAKGGRLLRVKVSNDAKLFDPTKIKTDDKPIEYDYSNLTEEAKKLAEAFDNGEIELTLGKLKDKDGYEIKILLCSPVVKEGYEFKDVKRMIIYNYNKPLPRLI